MEGLALGPGKCMFLCDLDWQEAIEHPKPRAPVYPGYGVRQTNNCWFSHDATKIQTKKLSILPRFYFHDVLEQLKSNFHTNFRFKTVLGFLKEYAWKSKLLLACVASVSNRVTARKLEREQKKKQKVFLLSSQLSRRTGEETLATQAKLLRDGGVYMTAKRAVM